ncbi:hypothetical protein CSW64_12405 [Caulobacter mirabilis]|uniref:Saccharopine dehydrogenase n=2 Tax=Caulobacter mirabilis TaxID=69666 RepID=A0A2D2B3Z3_9CAUL|nr:hypothetical protein CSW64_12405 [Caulobacter mirabilis]
MIARHLRAAGHDLDLILAGRHPESGEALAGELRARTARLDVADPVADLAAVGPVDLVIAALHDPGDHLQTAALLTGAGHISIVGTADSLMAPRAMTAAILSRRPALMLGHWLAGALTFAAMAAAKGFTRVDRIELASLYDYADPIGPMTAGDAEGFVGRALIRRDGVWATVEAAENGRSVTRGGGDPFDALPMGVLDTPGLAAVTGARDVRFDLGSGTSIGTAAGGPASHDLYIDLTGLAATGETTSQRTLVSDPKGQAHLTGLGVLIGVERLLGLDGDPPPAGGLLFPEQIIDPGRAVARMRSFGVRIEAAA